MIAVYPILVSRTVSENILPALTKTLEQYLITYSLDKILSDPRVNKQYKMQGNKIVAQESMNSNQYGDLLSEITPMGGSGPTGGKAGQRVGRQSGKDEEDAEKATAKVKMSDNRAIYLEPTFITVETGGRPQMLGIKVVPMRVASDAKLAHMMMYDYQMSRFRSILVNIGRKFIRRFYKNLLVRWYTRIVKGEPGITGDPREDIILAKSGFTTDIFVAVQKDDLSDAFFEKPKRIKKLFKMGWSNIVVTDDVNRVAYFCMREFRGTCSPISYHMMYQTLGQLKVYETLEDAKRQATSIFKVGPRFTKLIGECVCDKLVSKYSGNEDI